MLRDEYYSGLTTEFDSATSSSSSLESLEDLFTNAIELSF
jgi:hypothetical protein